MNPIATSVFPASDLRVNKAASFRPPNQLSSDQRSKFGVVRKQVRTAQNFDPDASLKRAEPLRET